MLEQADEKNIFARQAWRANRAAGHTFELSSSEAECAGWKRGSDTSHSSHDVGLRMASLQFHWRIPHWSNASFHYEHVFLSLEPMGSSVHPLNVLPALQDCAGLNVMWQSLSSACQPPTGFLPEDSKKKKNNQPTRLELFSRHQGSL